MWEPVTSSVNRKRASYPTWWIMWPCDVCSKGNDVVLISIAKKTCVSRDSLQVKNLSRRFLFLFCIWKSIKQLNFKTNRFAFILIFSGLGQNSRTESLCSGHPGGGRHAATTASGSCGSGRRGQRKRGSSPSASPAPPVVPPPPPSPTTLISAAQQRPTQPRYLVSCLHQRRPGWGTCQGRPWGRRWASHPSSGPRRGLPRPLRVPGSPHQAEDPTGQAVLSHGTAGSGRNTQKVRVDHGRLPTGIRFKGQWKNPPIHIRHTCNNKKIWKLLFCDPTDGCNVLSYPLRRQKQKRSE